MNVLKDQEAKLTKNSGGIAIDINKERNRIGGYMTRTKEYSVGKIIDRNIDGGKR